MVNAVVFSFVLLFFGSGRCTCVTMLCTIKIHQIEIFVNHTHCSNVKKSLQISLEYNHLPLAGIATLTSTVATVEYSRFVSINRQLNYFCDAVQKKETITIKTMN